MRRIGILMPWAANDPTAKARVGAFQQELQQLGWTDGRNIRIDVRWAAGAWSSVKPRHSRLGPRLMPAIEAHPMHLWPRCLGFHLRLYLVGYAVPEVPLDLLLGAA
jgi:hypothetical protein